uniref:Transposase n=1 Tax=Steinernema glaseri TaxID=37863 RepID=A0A1I7Z5W2_9BILA
MLAADTGAVLKARTQNIEYRTKSAKLDAIAHSLQKRLISDDRSRRGLLLPPPSGYHDGFRKRQQHFLSLCQFTCA